MKKLLPVFSLLIFCFWYSPHAQVAPSIEWGKCFGGSKWDRPEALEVTTDGGYVIAGYSASNDGDVSGNHGGCGYYQSDFGVVKLGSSGILQWQKCLGGTG